MCTFMCGTLKDIHDLSVILYNVVKNVRNSTRVSLYQANLKTNKSVKVNCTTQRQR